MKIKEIRISASRTINLGDFNSLKIEGECTVELGDKSIEVARQIALNEVKTQMTESYLKFKPKK